MIPATFSPLVGHLWHSTLFAAVAGLLTLTVRGNQARVRYGLWLTASYKFLLPFSWLVNLGHQFEWRAAPAVMPPTLSAVTSVIGDPVFLKELPRAMPAPYQPSVAAFFWVIWGVWACGFVVVAAGWTREWLRLRAIVNAASPLSLSLPIPVVSTPARLEPGVVGIFRPVLLLPEGITAHLTQAQLQTILAHEMCHIRRRDNLAAAIHMVVESIFWFHPLVWWLGACLVKERERACDEAVIAAGGDREAYAEALLKVCTFYVASSLPSAAGVSGVDLRKRVRLIMSPGKEQNLTLARKALLTASATATLLVPILIGSTMATTARVAAQTESPKGTSFQTASIRESQLGAISHTIHVGRDNFSVQNYTLRNLIAFAYDFEGALISGPDTSLDAKYNVDARAPGPLGNGYQAVDAARALVRGLLTDQFQIEVHRGTRLISAYVLTAAGASVLLKVARPEEPGPWMGQGQTSMSGTALRMDDFVELLSHRLDYPVLNQTGLTQTYDFKLDWKADSSSTAEPPDKALIPLTSPSLEVLADALQTQLGLRLQLQQSPAEVLIVDRAEPPKDLLSARKAVAMNPRLFDAYVGHYAFPGNTIMTVSRESERFWTQLSGQPPVEVFPEAQGKFFADVVDAQISFDVDARGRTARLILHQNGHDISAPRIDDAAAERMAEALKAKVQQQTSTPGSEQALRRLILGLADGKPDYEGLSDGLAQATKEQLPELQRTLAALGSLVSLNFMGVDPQGRDIYHAQFEHGFDEWHLIMAADGKIDSSSVGPNQ
jgi:uncharacterized protein (TIGR03435 family)